jgi:protoporphyrinogen oxidase
MEHQRKDPIKIGIIGGGSAGMASAYQIHKIFTQYYIPFEIFIFDKKKFFFGRAFAIEHEEILMNIPIVK